MKQRFVIGLAWVITALSISPAFAGFVYVPVLDRNGSGGSTHLTEVWLSNSGAQERRYATLFLPAGTNGTQRPVPTTKATLLPLRTNKLVGLSSPGAPGLLEIEAGTQVFVHARMANSPASGFAGTTEVPVISSDNALTAGSSAHLQGLFRDAAGSYTDLAVVNLSNQAATCDILFFRADGTQIGGTARVGVQPLSLRNFGDALLLLGAPSIADARAEVTCNQLFFAFAPVFTASRTLLSFVTPSASGASTLPGPTGPGPAPGAIVFERTGQVHMPVAGQEVRIINVPVAQPLALRRFIVEWDVVPGPWTASKPDGNHNLIWIHRGKYRSNTLANVNTFGPPRSGIKNTQNVDMAAKALTAQEVPLTLQQGVSYHLRYVYDAETNKITMTVTSGGATVSTLEMNGSAINKTITVPATGLFVQFGHTAAQAAEGIEFPTYGWVYSNLRIEMIP
ncbi:MAG: hypothetical protein QOH06_4075 [Acidobacteriota bacterium]|jgi:hypothetical protein|nr:hypothetical protein [Acidobacteriota bacterium]